MEEEREKSKRLWYKMRREAWEKMGKGMNRQPFKFFSVSAVDEEMTEERNDVYLYKTLRYPPHAAPPTIPE